MKNISLKVDENIFLDTEKILSKIKTSRNKYINEAIAFYNSYQKRRLLEQKLKSESEMVKNDSMKILKEFENIDYAD